ncbi:ABC transporter ATP-binding protein [Paenibacillus hunanensis]|uniref:ABC-2 type transport system ATP-binding protein n=1 Tax=Paenibacillus hunanensis TaxID=539262 RepID=A0ABU1J0T2_9BACL|nr:ABC transporter ATP-binding protein [Paenibacillus hunanensis]MCL9659553.1 ABC transporter ATP-binding protein [Paenibacillus hunanensis]MDR6245014.1 ABC-2 type transport system ATP-binding protein [Paenibacillus hunanensis]GGI96070.1 multidrug ABC transporter ATP-binding protein [Paenibacillus hunanensis]
MTQTAIHIDNLTKQYDNGRGCRNVQITVGQGEAFGFLGPNGAGKSTLVKMLVGLITPTSGTASLFGDAIGTVAAKRHIGYLPELYRYQEWLTGSEVVRLHARLCGLDKQTTERRIPELLDRVGIGNRGKDRVKQYSKGMQQRLGLACALVADPPILFLDEPSSALDPVGRLDVRTLLRELKQEGKTIFLNSHLLEEVENICDRIALLNNGEILRHGTVQQVLHAQTRWLFKIGGYTPEILPWLIETSGVQLHRAESLPDGERNGGSMGDEIWLEAVIDNEQQVGLITTLIVNQGMTLYYVYPVRERLEEWFMEAVSGLSHRGEQE